MIQRYHSCLKVDPGDNVQYSALVKSFCGDWIRYAPKYDKQEETIKELTKALRDIKNHMEILSGNRRQEKPSSVTGRIVLTGKINAFLEMSTVYQIATRAMEKLDND